MSKQRCLICNRVLKGEESKVRRIGPTCWNRLQRLAREDRAKRRAKLKLKKNVLKGQVTIFDMEGLR